MKSLFGIVENYRSDLQMLPIMILLFVMVTLLIYLLFHSSKWLKYLPSFIGIAIGVGCLLTGFGQKATIEGLDWMWRGICFFVAGCIALATAWLVALIESFSVKREENERQIMKRTPENARKAGTKVAAEKKKVEKSTIDRQEK